MKMKPKIRFKGFEGEWDKVKLGNIFCERNESNINGEMLSVTQHNGIIKASENGRYDNSNSDKSNYKVVKVGDIAYNSMRMWQGASGYSPYEGIVSPAYTVIIPQEGIYSPFFAYLFKNENIINTFRLHSQGLTSDTWNLKYPAFSKIEVLFPEDAETKEQQTIASFLSSFDRQISLQTQRLEKLKQIKAGSLQAMFPQEGETMPKVRFKGFKGEWKKVKFSEIFEFLKNNSLSRAKLSNEGEVANVHYGDVLIKFGDLLNVQSEELTYITDNRVGYNLYTNSCLQDGDVIITDAAEDNTVGKCSEIMNVGNMKIVSGLHTIPCRPFKCFAQGYLGHYMNSESYHGQLLPLIQGSKISSISKKVLSQTSVFVPSLEEQQKIAVYFTSLDRQITLHSQRLEKLKQIKAACLDKMFV